MHVAPTDDLFRIGGGASLTGCRDVTMGKGHGGGSVGGPHSVGPGGQDGAGMRLILYGRELPLRRGQVILAHHPLPRGLVVRTSWTRILSQSNLLSYVCARLDLGVSHFSQCIVLLNGPTVDLGC